MQVNRFICQLCLLLVGVAAVRLPAEEAKADRKFFQETIVAAQKGDPVAQCALGACFESGHGVVKDLEAAVKWYRKAAEQGDALAQCALGTCCEKGRGVEKDPAQAAKWYAKSAAQGCARAQFSLGACYANGVGLAKDYLQAHKWYTQAALKGLDPAKKALPDLERRMTPEQLAQARRAAAPLLFEKKVAH